MHLRAYTTSFLPIRVYVCMCVCVYTTTSLSIHLLMDT